MKNAVWHCSPCNATISYGGTAIVTSVTCPYCQAAMTKIDRVRIIPLEPKVMRRKSFLGYVLDGFRAFRLWLR